MLVSVGDGWGTLTGVDHGPSGWFGGVYDMAVGSGTETLHCWSLRQEGSLVPLWPMQETPVHGMEGSPAEVEKNITYSPDGARETVGS